MKSPSRRQPLKRSKIKKRPRSRSERERIYGPKGYVEWIHEQRCAVCWVEGYSQCAHLKSGGVGRKDDWTRTLPLCGPRPGGLAGCHWQAHSMGRQTFEAHNMVDLEQLAKENHTRWLSFSGGSPKTGNLE